MLTWGGRSDGGRLAMRAGAGSLRTVRSGLHIQRTQPDHPALTGSKARRGSVIAVARLHPARNSNERPAATRCRRAMLPQDNDRFEVQTDHREGR